MKRVLLITIVLSIIGVGTVYSRDDFVEVIGDFGYYGDWGRWEYCPAGSYAAGYSMKVEPDTRGGDDTAVNGIKLICLDKETRQRTAEITSTVQQWGFWNGETYCPNTYLKRARLFNEPPQGDGDDTGTNSIQFICLSGQPIEAAGGMPWGKPGPYLTCPGSTVICGIQTRVERSLGNGDDTALNGANFACCEFN